MKQIIKTETEMHAFAAELAATLRGGEVLALTGELGAGKTTFTKGIANAFGINAVVQSPTFLLLKCYPVPKTQDSRLKIQSLCHVDAYRIKKGDELLTIGLAEHMADSHTVTVIEWADRVKEIIPSTARWISFNHGTYHEERIVEVL